MRTPVALLLVVLLASSGCIETGIDGGGAKASAAKPPGGIESIPRIGTLRPVADTVRVSPAGDRMAEFMVAKNPTDPQHLIIAAHDYDAMGTGTLACVLYVSRDGGASWTETKPIPGLQRPHLQFDGWVSFDANGVAHFICLDYDRADPAPQTWAYYSSSTDGGQTWSQASVIAPLRGCDKTSLHAARDGRVYAMCSNRLTFTDDGGKTWSTARSPGGSNPNGFAEGRDGTIYVGVRGTGGSRVARSSDRGETWNASVVGPFDIPPGYNDQNRWVDQRPWTTLPSIWISPVTDHLFVAQQTWDESKDAYVTHVYRSIDDGMVFERVSTPDFASPSCTPCSVTKPSITVDSQGRLGLLVQVVNEGGHVKEVLFSASSDEGESWLKPITLSKTSGSDGWANPRAFTPSLEGAAWLAAYVAQHPTDAPMVAVGLALTSAVQELQMRWNGEYWGINSSPKGFVTLWIDHSADGVPQVYSRLVATEPDGPRETAA